MGAFGGTLAKDFEHGAEITDGSFLLGAPVDVDHVLALGECSMQNSVERLEKAFSPRDAKAGVLAFSHKGLELLGF